jgi:hypothetical protein
MYRNELAERAALLRRLGYPAEQAISRLCANVAWDFEVDADGRPEALRDDAIAEIVRAAYARHRGH